MTIFLAVWYIYFHGNAFHQKVIPGPDASTVGKAAISIMVAWSALTVRGAVQELKKAERKDEEDANDDLPNFIEAVPLQSQQQQSYPLICV